MSQRPHSQPYRIPLDEIERFDEEVDILVAGYGYAGAVAAIEAHDAGASVMIAEKLPYPGGISILAGGGVRVARDADAAFAYLKATNDGTTPDDVLRVLADGMVWAEGYLQELAEPLDAEVGAVTAADAGGKGGGNYPFPGWETFAFTRVNHIPNFDPSVTYPHIVLKDSSRGRWLFRLVEYHVERRGIPVWLESPVLRLIVDGAGEVVGAVLGTPGGEAAIKARKGVILACGGFENDDEMKAQYWQAKPVLTAAALGNTGDGIRMAQAVGADLWHMWHFHGVYGFRHPDPAVNLALRTKRLPDWRPGSKQLMDVKMAWILVDQNGERYMNECSPYTHDTSHRPMQEIDTEAMKFTRIPSFLICDDEARKLYPLGEAKVADPRYRYEWSADNLKEVENGILKRADTVAELAALIGVDAAALEATVTRWNDLCAAGEDEDFGRPGGTMMPIATPPFVVGEVWPVVTNTQGGPVHDAKQRVLDPGGSPIPRLYAAGELGSSFGYLYLSGGNVVECFVTGRVAARDAAALPAWDRTG